MNKFFKHKFLSFTLAEMMVVLALFSVISAATMPVITARQQLEGASSTTGGVEGDTEDPWTKYDDHKALSYYNETQPNDSAVMVGNNVSSASVDLGKPRLIVTDGFGTGSNGQDDGSHIVLFKDVSGTPYYTGRIMMSNNNSQSSGSIAIGSSALAYHSNTSNRNYNVALGSNAMAMQDSDNSSSNKVSSVAIGANALFGSGVSAYNSVAIGNNASNLSSADGSVAIGANAGASTSKTNSKFDKSVAIGYHALSALSDSVSASYSVAIGTYANVRKKLENSTAIGYYAGYDANKNGANFVAIGARALSDVTNDGESVAIGYYAGYQSGDRVQNSVMIGAYAGNRANLEEGSSVFIGNRAGVSRWETRNTVIVGHNAGNVNYATTGDAYFDKGSVYLGQDAGYRDSTETDGETNFAPSVVIGYQAGYFYNMGASAYSIFMGAHSGNDTSAMDSVCIGAYACSGSRSNFMQGPAIVRISPKNGYWARQGNSDDLISLVGDVPEKLRNYALNNGMDKLIMTPLYGNLEPSTSSVNSSIILFGNVFSAKTTFSTFSDKRLKENIKLAKYGLNEIRKINVYNYNWLAGDTKTPQIGVIAQEVQKIIPESVHVNNEKKLNGYLTVDSSWFLFSMINAIKELDSQVLTIKNKLVAYSKEYVSLVQRVNKLEKEVKVLENENKTLTRDVKVAYTKVKKAERR